MSKAENPVVESDNTFVGPPSTENQLMNPQPAGPVPIAPSIELRFPFCEDLVRPGPTTLQVEQKMYRWFKKSGRGFTITENAADGLPLFVIESGKQGKRRNFQDRDGTPLFDVRRNWMSQKKAWEVLDAEDKVVMTIRYEWYHSHMTLEAVLPGAPRDVAGNVEQTVVRIRGSDVWQRVQEARVVKGDGVEAAGEPFLRAECTNMPAGGMGGFLSSFQVTPPIWEVRVAEGVNLGLASVLAVAMSDVYSESRIYMW
ncbi:hypothetical protein MBLNU230_g5680t1 [Neophaeotheca triangularis]